MLPHFWLATNSVPSMMTGAGAYLLTCAGSFHSSDPVVALYALIPGAPAAPAMYITPLASETDDAATEAVDQSSEPFCALSTCTLPSAAAKYTWLYAAAA